MLFTSFLWGGEMGCLLAIGGSPDKQGGFYISTFFWFLVKQDIANIEKIDSSEVVIANGVRFLVGVNMYLFM